ncbi:MAG: ABC transporter ATP-binding protein, partial [Clostridia bacterium]|nr:ABC transporter ATP-binding protein [Clostridia bacterium]
KHLKKYFKEVKAVDDISFVIKKGELFAFLGLNGAGKSTTINIICSALEKDSGEVYVDGLSIDKDMKEITSKIGVVFQNSVLDSKLSVKDNLRYRAGLYNLTAKEFQENLEFLSEKLEFKDILNRPLFKLSGGQKRRIDIARALIHNPKILILDEPTTGLDPKTRILVWDLIDKLRKEKELTVLLTTHYMEEASEADYVVIIDSGKVVASDTPNNLKNQYANDFLRVYQYDKKLLKVLEKNKLNYTTAKGFVEVEFSDIKQIKDVLIENKDLISDFEVIKGKMDNVFLNVTGKSLKEF